MQLHIAPNRIVADIQYEFNKAFPYLKIEFFNNRTFKRNGFMANQILPHSKRIGDSQLHITDGDIRVEKDMKVKDLENLFRDQFSLAVQVFRKSGNLWLETTMTDNWTLEQQNKHGMEISSGRKATDEPGDYDLSRDADH